MKKFKTLNLFEKYNRLFLEQDISEEDISQEAPQDTPPQTEELEFTSENENNYIKFIIDALLKESNPTEQQKITLRSYKNQLETGKQNNARDFLPLIIAILQTSDQNDEIKNNLREIH